ncbi:gamma-glutamyl-gamma-aminobutyrate hydrolase family protein [Micromonospora sp. NPDC023956]|uniref:gamma-glutamyl-gamma-aminobutyrate hydrolase family protein n=1 Tax=Micromonospora sp. NPDC023956 TaxID=3155722 RepID=UPI0033E2077F
MSGPSVRPVVGISTYEEHATWRGWHRRASLVPTDFVGGLAEVGAIPVLLPPSGGDAEATRVLAGVDGVLLVGGADIDPALYGGQVGPHTGTLAPERDRWESALLRVALAANLPVLGVCRGMQLLNVVRGGSLTPHLPALVGTDDHQPAGSEFATNRIRLRADALPGSVLGAEQLVACYHHQSIDALGGGLVASGWTEDGTVETISDPDRRFVVGVQWHPEIDPERRLFRAFVEAARERHLDTPTPAGPPHPGTSGSAAPPHLADPSPTTPPRTADDRARSEGNSAWTR